MLFVITFFVLVLFIAFMAVGVIFSNKRLKGSCGGLGKVMGDKCSFCGKKEECEKRKNTVSA